MCSIVYFCTTLKITIMKRPLLLALLASTLLVSESFTSAFTFTGPSQTGESSINWITWAEAEALSATEKRKIMVDLYTDWCGWCKKMDAATFQQSYISEYVNDHFYAIKFNAEMKEDLVFRGKTYSFVANGRRGYHELAAQITNGRLGYPTVVFLDEEMEVIQALPGYKEPGEFEKIISYFAEDYHKKMSWDKYHQSYGTPAIPSIPREKP
jgi:thioredoxin-related protein